MRRFAFALTVAALAAASTLSACAGVPPTISELSPESGRAVEAGGKLGEARALMTRKRYDQAIERYVDAAGEGATTTEAVDGAVAALEAKLASERLGPKLDGVVALQKRLPAGAGREKLHRLAEDYLCDHFIVQARQASRILKDRGRFIGSMRDDGEADVMPTPTGPDRVLTEAEVVEARKHLDELGMNQDIWKLYTYGQPLAAAMDRFLADDRRYLAEEGVTEEALDELGESCEALGEGLWPVQRQLDRVRPDWRDEG